MEKEPQRLEKTVSVQEAGKLGGQARAQSLNPQERVAIARYAAFHRWSKKK